MFAFRATVVAALIAAVGIGGYFVWRDTGDRRYADCIRLLEDFDRSPASADRPGIQRCIDAGTVTAADLDRFGIPHLLPRS